MPGKRPFTLCLLPLACAAAAQPAPEPDARLEEVTVTATMLPRRSEDIAGTVTLIDAAAISRQVANSLDDLARYQPGVTMETAGRGGNQGFNIRGIGGNRVLMLVDGMRSADIYAAGPSSYGKDMFEVDDLKAVEIIRGPASVLYGADAMGGAVLLRSKDPGDYLAPGENTHIGLRTSAASDNDQFKAGVTLAGRRGNFDTMLQYTQREFSEREVKGPGRLNPQDGESGNLLWKGVWRPGEVHLLSLTVDYNEQEVDTRLDNEISSSVFSSIGLDTSERLRVGLQHEWRLESALADELRLQAAWQDTDARQYSEQVRTSYSFVDPRNPASARGTEAWRWSDFQFNQENIDLGLIASRDFDLGGRHALVYGFSFERTDTERPRDRCDVETATGRVSCAIPSYPFAPPEIFPNKTFPDTRTDRLGFFIQDEFKLPGERLTLIPGLRYNRYEMDPRPDALLNGSGDISEYGGFSVGPVEEDEVSLNFGLLYALSDGLSLFAQYAEGFRPPNFDESNQAFVNLGHGYATIPNPELRAESSHGVEAGLRAAFDSGVFSLSAYDNRYRDFIDSALVGTVDDISLFQDANVGKARIHGVEATLSQALGERWSWRASLAWARGKDESAHAPLDSVDPLNGVAGLRYQSVDGRLEVEGILTIAAAQTRVAAPERAKSEAWQTIDLVGRYALGERLNLRFGLFNLFDEEYAPWGAIRGLAVTDTANLERAHMPGVNARLGLDYRL